MALTPDGLIHTPGISSNYVRLANGARAHYVSAGLSGPAVVLLHGGIVGSSGMAGWRFMIPYLAEHGLRVYAPDRPGYGFADTRPEYHAKSWIDQVEFVQMFADALCLDKFYIGGNSQGTQTAVLYMINHPDRILGAALVATGNMWAFAGVDPSKIVSREGGGGMGSGGTKESMYNLLEPIIHRKEGLVDELLEMRTIAANRQRDAGATTGVSPRENSESSIAQFGNATGRLSKLTFPIIYLHGQQDTFAPVENARLAEPLLPNVQFFYPDDTGHQGQTDSPEVFNQVFLEFLRDGKVSRATADRVGVSKGRPENPELIEQAAGATA